MAFRRPKHRGTAESGDTAVLEKAPADGLAVELAAAAPRQWWNRWTLGLAAVLLLGGGVMAGVEIQQRWGTAATSGPGGGTAFPGGAQGGGGFSGGARQQGGPQSDQESGQSQGVQEPAAGTATEGTVKLVNGTTVYIVTADGRTITVRTSGDTTVTKATEGTLSDLAEGDTVTVEGATGDDSSVTAITITEE